jgi:hypothetical protein
MQFESFSDKEKGPFFGTEEGHINELKMLR